MSLVVTLIWEAGRSRFVGSDGSHHSVMNSRPNCSHYSKGELAVASLGATLMEADEDRPNRAARAGIVFDRWLDRVITYPWRALTFRSWWPALHALVELWAFSPAMASVIASAVLTKMAQVMRRFHAGACDASHFCSTR